MSDFLKHYQLVLTPLSPIHVGIGEDYEVTNYVIDDSFMYVFEPSRVALTEQQRQSLKSSATDLLELQKFFKDNKDSFKPYAHHLVAVTSGIQQEYTKLLGQEKDNKALSQLQIQRSAYESHTLNNFIPGSAIKGMIRTAVLEALSGNKPELTLAQKADLSRKYTNFEKGLIGSFSSDAMRALKVSDLSAQNNFVASNIQFAINRKKNIGVPSHAPVVRIESIVMGQYRAFTGTSVMQQFSYELGQRVNKPLEVLPRTIAKNMDLSSMAKATNLYHYSRFLEEMKLLVALDCVDDNWLSSTKILLESLKPAMAEGRIMLVRLGKYGGAENKTIKKLAHIRIKPSKGAAFFAQETLTVWLASDSQSKNAQKMLPFGWAIIEINPQGDNRALKAWCEKNHSSLNRIKQAHQKWEQDRFHEIEQQQAQLKKEQEAEQQRKKEEEDRIAKELAQKQEQQAKRAAMSEGTLCVDNIKLLFENFTYNLRNQSENDAKFSELKEALIVAQQFSLNEKQIVVNELAYKKLAAIAKGLLVGNKEKEIKSLLQQLREA